MSRDIYDSLGPEPGAPCAICEELVVKTGYGKLLWRDLATMLPLCPACSQKVIYVDADPESYPNGRRPVYP